MTEARTPQAQQVLQMYNDVQLCREMGWTEAQLEEASEEFVWLCMQVMGLEGEKMKDDERRQGRNPHAQVHHEVR